LLRLRMGYPSPDDERAILRGKAGMALMNQIEPVLTLAEVEQIQHEAAMLHRAAQAWALLEGRRFCLPDDIKRLFVPVCAHRVILRARHGESRAESAAHVLESIADLIPVPE